MKKNKCRVLWCMLVGGMVIGFLPQMGCSVDLDALLASLDEGTPAAGLTPASEGDDATADLVRIRFRNLTADEAVNVEFHVTQEPLENLPEDLFVEENLVTASIGIAGTGIIRPHKEDVIEFPCTPNLTIGTGGGSFVDDESGEPRGAGTPRWAQEGPLALCGSVVTFEFSGNGTDFSTALTISR